MGPPPPPYTQEQVAAMTSPAEKLRAYSELTSYIARLKRENQERENHYTNAFNPKHGNYNHGVAHYHPYQRPRITPKSMPKSTHNSATWKPAESATHSQEASNTEPLTEQPTNNTVVTSDRRQANVNRLCRTFTSAGICFRPGCPYFHDPNKQAVCKHWFYKDSCLFGDKCSLSHDASPHNAPTCVHFQAGRCNNEDCRFAHIRVNPSALNCESFGNLGYCDKGDTCTELHAHECPSFANTGTCRYGDDCHQRHVRRASRMRTTTRLSPSVRAPSSNNSNRSNTPEHGLNTPEYDLDTTEDTVGQTKPTAGIDQEPHQFTQQADFVPFDTDA